MSIQLKEKNYKTTFRQEIIEPISFSTLKIEDSSLEKGKEIVETPGEDGEKVLFNEIIYIGIKEFSRNNQVKIIKKPVEKVVKSGTKEVSTPLNKTEDKPKQSSVDKTLSNNTNRPKKEEKPKEIVNNNDSSKPNTNYTKNEVEYTEVKYSTLRENDSSLDKGQEVISQHGKNGKIKRTYKTTYSSNGAVIKKDLISEENIESVVNQIIKVGTKEVSLIKELPHNYNYTYEASLENEMLRLINEHRANHGKPALSSRSDLNKSARYKSLSMLQYNYFSHTNPNYNNNSSGYLLYDIFQYNHYNRVGENLVTAYSTSDGFADVKEAFDLLVNSSAHNNAMLNSDYKYIGIGVVKAVYPGSAFHGLPVIIISQHFAR